MKVRETVFCGCRASLRTVSEFLSDAELTAKIRSKMALDDSPVG